jgi:hypothetical protein
LKLLLKHQAHDSSRCSERVENCGHQYVGVHHDPSHREFGFAVFRRESRAA